MNLFYSPRIEDNRFVLDEPESRHVVRVLRLGIGDRVVLVNGRGGWYDAAIEDAHPKRCQLRILSHTPDYQPLPYQLHLAVSPTKSIDRFEWFLEKATEIGITEITPLICHRTERKYVKLERLDRILVSAMKQSLKAYKPILHQPADFSEFVQQDRPGSRGIAHCHDDRRKGISTLMPAERYTFIVGPEGDFTEEEVQAAMDAGYTPFHLGTSRLRTETAGVYICAAVSLIKAQH